MQDAKGETVSGMVIITKGSNGRDLINEVKKKSAEIKLPPGVRIMPFYDQSEVIDGTIETVKRNLLEGSALVDHRPLVVPRQLARCADRGKRDPSSFVVWISGNGSFRSIRQPDELGSGGFRNDCGWLCSYGGEHDPPDGK